MTELQDATEAWPCLLTMQSKEVPWQGSASHLSGYFALTETYSMQSGSHQVWG